MSDLVAEQLAINKKINIALHIYPGKSEPIILLHGGPGGYDYLGPVAEMLSPPQLAIGYDQRGGGASTRRGPYGIVDYVNDLEALRTHIDVERLHIFGHSWGGLLAQIYAAYHPQRIASLVLCSSAAGLGAAFMQEERAASRAIFLRNPLVGLFSHTIFAAMLGSSNLMSLLAPMYFAYPEQVAREDLAILRQFDGGSFNATLRSIMYSSNSLLQRLSLDGHVPIMRLRGQHDLFVASERSLRRRFPQAQEVWFEESGHFPWIEEPEKFKRVLCAFYTQNAYSGKE
ncbi:alpha/beta fold hydrolase [Dictyobacter kobayashii]|uniref:Alpha/beta hydrolase n=1 Tax=Dictyobacter kobayashii TaxID=2014872 RepID=A0A402AV53_9CHLR|nr:alpha/beta hydrolase [Dictyobacter kobayashii]GCE22965.1 alpha/beta hydrolase [Dictyobacter kobayashii]